MPRKEGLSKVTGTARYIDDIEFPEMLHGVTVRSTIPRGRIKEIRFDSGIPWDEFTIVTAKDIPVNNYVALIVNDQPCLADRCVNHAEEAIVLLAHPDKYLVEEARRAVHIDYEPLPPIFTIADSLAKKEIVWGQDNIFKSYSVDKGDVDSAWAEAAFIVEGEYETGAQEQLYIEPQGIIARAIAGQEVTVWGSLQCPYYVHKALVPIFGLPKERIRVVQAETGGGFGGKEEYPSMHRRARGTARLEIRQAGENDLRPRRRYGRHHQAPSLRARGIAPRSRATENSWPWTSTSSLTAVRTSRCLPWCSLAAPFTLPGLIFAPMCACADAPSQRMCRLTALFADSALRKACSRSNGISIVSLLQSDLPPDELRRRNFIQQGQTHRHQPGHPRKNGHEFAYGPRLRSLRLPRKARSIRTRKSHAAL